MVRTWISRLFCLLRSSKHCADAKQVDIKLLSRISAAPAIRASPPTFRMALATRASVSVKACAPARAVRPVAVRPMAALNKQQAVKVAGAGLASVALAAAFAAAPVSAVSLDAAYGLQPSHKWSAVAWQQLRHRTGAAVDSLRTTMRPQSNCQMQSQSSSHISRHTARGSQPWQIRSAVAR